MRLSPGIAAATAAVLVAIACRDSSGPDGPLTVELRVANPPAYTLTETIDGPIVSCEVEFVAEARGRGAANWGPASFSWYFGRNRVASSEVDHFDAYEVQASWGSAGIDADGPMRATWTFTAGAPFEVEASFQYLAEGRATPGVATTSFSCGPALPTGNAAPPTITEVTVAGGLTEIQPGDALSIDYRVSAPGGLWSTGVTVWGAFERWQGFAERGATTANRTTSFAIPGGLSLDQSVWVSVFAVDQALDDTVYFPPVRLRLVDRTPPTIREAYLRNTGSAHMAGQYGVGDVLPLSVTGVDNNAIAWLIYSLGAPANIRDSVAAPPRQPGHTWNLSLPIAPEWVGSPLLSVQVRDAVGLTSAVISSTPDSLRVFPTVTYPVTPELRFSPDPFSSIGDMTYDARRALMYIAQPQEKRILVLSVETMTLGSPIPLPETPAGIDLMPGGDSLIIAFPGSRSLGVLRLHEATQQTIGMIPLTVLDTAGSNVLAPVRPVNVKVAATGVAIVTLDHATRSQDQVLSVDLRTGAQQIRTDARGTYEHFVRSTERTHDHARIAIMARFCTRVYVAATDTFTPCGDAAWGDGANVTLDATGSRVAYGGKLFDSQLKLLRERSASATALTPDGTIAFEGAGSHVRKARTSDGIVVERFPIPFSARLLYVTPDGRWLLVFEPGFGPRVARVDLR